MSEKLESRVIREASAIILLAVANLPDGPSWLASQLHQESFISSLYVTNVPGISPYDKATRLLPAVEVQIKTNQNSREPFLKFVKILQSNPALVHLAQDLVRRYRSYGGMAELPLPVSISRTSSVPSRKPGQLSTQDLPVLLDKLQVLAHQWMSLGIQLEFDPNLLQVIRSTVHHDPTAALQELMTRWVQRTYPPPLLRSLSEAIGSRVVGNSIFARNLLQDKSDFPSIQEDMGLREPTYQRTDSAPQLSSTVATAQNQLSSQERELDEGDLVDIADYIGDLDNAELYHLGVLLGLSQARVQKMKEELDSITFCDSLITAWLAREDYVERRGVPHWSMLVKCLRHNRFKDSKNAERIAGQISEKHGPFETSN